MTIDPRLPEEFLPLTIEQLPIGNYRTRLEIDHDGYRLTGLPAGIEIRSSRSRHPSDQHR